MKDRKVKVAVIGAGSAGMSAFREASKLTDDIVIINGGHYGTTCARVGCMPSKLLLQVAHDYHRREVLEDFGIRGGEHLDVDFLGAMERVRSMRDRFVRGILGKVEKIGDKNIEGYAKFLGPNRLAVGDITIEAESIVIATGSRPFVPASWGDISDRILTSDTIFELTERPASLGVIGAGPMGVELGQAMSRLGCRVTVFDGLSSVGGLTDPVVNESAIKIFREEMDVELGHHAQISRQEDELIVSFGDQSIRVDRILATMGRKPNIERLNLQEIGVPLNERGLPEVDPGTMQVGNLRIFMAGDVNADRPLLHEAID